MTHLLGDTGVIASRIGDDHLGREAREVLDRLEAIPPTSGNNWLHPTGSTVVHLAADGQPSYEIRTRRLGFSGMTRAGSRPPR